MLITELPLLLATRLLANIQTWPQMLGLSIPKIQARTGPAILIKVGRAGEGM